MFVVGLLGNYISYFYIWYYSIYKEKKILGIFQSILSLVLPIWSLIFSLNRDYLIKKESEIEFLYKNVVHGNVEAILITLLYLILIMVVSYNVFTFKKKI